MASTDLSLRQAFVLTDTMYRRFRTLIERHTDPISVRIGCADGIEREFANADRLLEYDNLSTNEIVWLQMNANSDDWNTRVSLTLLSDQGDTMHASLTSPSDEVIVTLRQGLVTLFRDMRPWYARIAALDFVVVALLIFVATWVISVLLVGLGLVGVSNGNVPDPAGKIRTDARAWATLLLTFGAGCALNWLRTRIFPAGVFAIGEGIQRYQTKDRIRWTVVVGLIISVVGSLIVGWMN